MATRLKLHEMEREFEDTVTAESGEAYAHWLGVPVPPGWSLIVDCEGGLVAMVPPVTFGCRESLAEPHDGDAAGSLQRARVIAELLNASREHYPFEPEED